MRRYFRKRQHEWLSFSFEKLWNNFPGESVDHGKFGRYLFRLNFVFFYFDLIYCSMDHYDVIIIGGGQSGLSVAYYLRRTGLSYLILDREISAGGSWQHYWESLRLFSPAQWSSLPGVLMPGGPDYYPTKKEASQYIQNYESRYCFPVQRPVEVKQLSRENGHFRLETSKGAYGAKAVVSATGSFRNPYIPDIPGMEVFQGEIIHSSAYRHPEEFSERRVAIFGEGNSGAQILAGVSQVADTLWITKNPPNFLPDHVDGRFLFDVATRMYEARQAGKSYQPPSLGDIVMVPPVREARSRGALKSLPPVSRFDENGLQWQDGRKERIDVAIFCTGFNPVLGHLKPLGISGERPRTDGARSLDVEGLWLVGYGNWTGFASATLIGVGRSARTTAQQISAFINKG